MSSDENLTIAQFEALVRLKQRRVTEDKVARFAVAEVSLSAAYETGEGWDLEAPRPAGAPESWRGAQGRDRYFRSVAPVPLDGRPGRHAQGWTRTRAPRLPRPSAGHLLGPDRPSAVRRSWRGKLLLGFEALALVGFLVILALSYVRLQALNREAREAQQAALTRLADLATVAPAPADREQVPTPLLVADMSRPTSQPTVWRGVSLTSAPVGGAVPTRQVSPTPLHPEGSATPTITPLVGLRAQDEAPATASGTENVAPTGAPLPSPPELAETAEREALALGAEDTPDVGEASEPSRLVIPALLVDAPVVAGDGVEELKAGVGHRLGSALPGEPGNLVLSAHNDVYGALFRDLHKLAAGEEVQVYAGERLYRYRVDSVEIVTPSRVDLVAPTDEATVTLITCYPYLIDTHRVVVKAKLIR